MKEKEKQPEFRFCGFTDPWEQRKLGDAVEVNSGRDYKHLDFGEIPVYGTGGYMLSVSEALSEKDDAIGIGRKGTIDNPYILKAPFWTVDTLFYCVPKQQDISFIYGIFQNINWKSKDESTGVPSLSKQTINNIPVKLPKLFEQQSIGSFLSTLDHLITLQQRELDSLKSLKKTLLSKLFPKNAESFPGYRFQGFNDPWEQRKLRELCESFEYGLNVSAKEYDGKNKYLRITDIDDETRRFLYSNLTSPNIDINEASEYLLKTGAILFSRTGASVGKTYLYDKSDGDVYYAGFLIKAQISNNYSPEFVFQNTLTNRYLQFVQITSQRSGQPGINAQEYANYCLEVPSLQEQQSIGSFFSTLDHLITLQQRELEILKAMKKTWLKKLFP